MEPSPERTQRLERGGGYTHKANSVDVPYKRSAVRAFYFAIALDLDLDLDLAFDLDRAIKKSKASDPELSIKISDLKEELPSRENRDMFNQWWETAGPDWLERLRTAMIDHRNVGHNWNLTTEQREQLQQYYQSNLLLVQCLNSDCYVTKETRQEIEASLLLPFSDLDP